MNLIIGIITGLFMMWLYIHAGKDLVVAWFAWVLFIIGAISLALGVDIISGSIIEHEMQAGWMGLGMCIFITVLAYIIGWRYGVIKRSEISQGE